MRVTRLWERELGWARLFRAGDTLVVHDATPGNRDGSGCPTRSFDLRTREPLGPVFGMWETICLADIPERWPAPLLAHVESAALVVSDSRDGAFVERFPLPAVGDGRSLDDLAVARVRGRDRLYLLDNAGSSSCAWGTVDLDSPAPAVDWCDPFMLYSGSRERMSLDGAWLAVPAEEYVDFFYDDPQSYPEIIPEGRVRVYRVSDGEMLGQVDADGHEAVVATVGGRSYLAQEGCVRSLPDLAPVVGLSGPTGVALAEWEGQPVAVFAQVREEVPIVAGQHRPVRLVHCFLDGAENTERPEPALTRIPWEVPGKFQDLLAVPNREVVVATSEGVYVVTVDP
ncbi:hypothetical protein NE857_15180 [Nocardiopsis exhalans]|uniref:Uncharacterized protein n=1 Tax=Nocardiopsis exhalans TaxID=163604 RepID=A0ABY5DER6_9ACTN|nr:hypothetical protein [Nocardiopsis exhalans]USY22832.1 hypothetical protein NE857_15180 [Nocardiopsis exhalans]